MRPHKPPRFVLAIVVACFVLPTVAVGARLPLSTSSPALPTANTTTYQDSTGEDPAAPDISTIVVSNTDAGMLSFQINIPNRPTLGQDMFMVMWVDTDNNGQTGAPIDSGEPPGTDYVLELFRGEINLYRWDGTGFTRSFGDPSAVTLSFSYANGITVRIAASELGNTKRFRFYVLVVSGIAFDPVTQDPYCPSPPCPSDDAPGGGAGLYPFEVKITPPTLVVRRLTPSPAKPAAGRSFTLRLVAARSDTGAVVQNGRVTCVGRAGTTRLRVQTARVTGGAAVCTWLVPKLAKGKTFRGSVAVTFEGLTAKRSFSERIA